MFKKLFGNGGSASKPQAQPASVDVSSTMEKLDNQIENIDKRGKVLENQMNALKMEALQKKKAKDTRGTKYFF